MSDKRTPEERHLDALREEERKRIAMALRIRATLHRSPQRAEECEAIADMLDEGRV